MKALWVAALLSICPEGMGLEGAARQRAACELAARPGPEVAPDTYALQRLLADPQFARVRRRNGSLVAVLWDRFLAWVKSFFETDQAATFAKATPFAVLALALGVALLALVRFARGPGGQRAPAAAPEASGPLELEAAPVHLLRARQLLATAPREAIREGLLALLSSLEAKHLARPDRVKTNRELCRELEGRGAGSRLVQAVTAQLDWYDLAFYSLAEVPAAEARRFVAEIEALV